MSEWLIVRKWDVAQSEQGRKGYEVWLFVYVDYKVMWLIVLTEQGQTDNS